MRHVSTEIGLFLEARHEMLVHILDGRHPRRARGCGIAIAIVLAGGVLTACGGELGSGAIDAGGRDARASIDGSSVIDPFDAAVDDAGDGGESIELDAGASDLDGGVSELDAGVSDLDAGPTCASVACSSVTGTTTEDRVATLDECAFGLVLEAPLADGEALADRLLARLVSESVGTRRDLDDVRADLNRVGRAGLSSATTTRLAGLSPRGFRWTTGDDDVDYWYPQGITGSADAAIAGGSIPGSLLLVAWYHKTTDATTRGVRLSLVDVSDLASPRYRHLLLVEPVEGAGGVTFTSAEYDSGGALHAGGIAWIGDRIYVADTSQGLRVYDLSRMFSPSRADDTTRIGIAGGRSDAHGYAYAVPRVGRYVRAPGTCSVRFSFVARGDAGGAPALITGEYVSDTPNGRLVAWPLDTSTGLLAGSGTAYAIGAAIGGQTRVQGGLRVGERWYMSSSSQDGSDGRLYVGRAGAASTSVAWIYGCEDLYLDASDRIWTVGEHPGRRDVVSIPRP